ncbi:PASTA domain-containing protein [Actinomadura scrupuli]|uniref:PASTA domain-containing protein n=1 Tax=Actinomadura scrupuli TaxID=559629 RepID=UPI003D964220
MRIRYAAIAAALLVTGCGGAAPAPAVTVTVSASPTAGPPGAGAAPVATESTAPKRVTAAPKKVRVPNLVGTNHQVAQDTLQAAGFYRLVEKDATGQDRLLLWDRNWVVVRQSPRGGTLADPKTTTVTLYSKKIGE